MSHDTPKEKPPSRKAPGANDSEDTSRASVPQHPYAARPIDERLAALQAVPPAMAAAPQWLLYRLVPKDAPGKWDKVPHYVRSLQRRHGEQGTEADRAALVPLQEALAALRRHARRFDGVGFAVLPDGAAACVDLDGDAAVAANAQLLAATWAERSVGGHGAHAWFAGAGLPHGKNLPAGVEAFAANGFVAVTGLPLPGAAGSASRALAPAAGAWATRVQALLGAPGSSPGLPGPAAEGAGAARSIPSPWDAALAVKVRHALSMLDPDTSYPNWVRVGMALHSADPDVAGPAFAAWLAWSKQGAKFAGAKDLRTHWRSFGQQGGVTVAALFAMYRERTGRSINDVEAEADEADFPASRPEGAAAAPAGGAAPPHRFDLGEVADTDRREPRVFVEGLLSYGAMLLVGMQKGGKTFFMLQLAAALNTGGTFLGCRVTAPVKVAVLALEEGKVDPAQPPDSQPKARLAARIRAMGLVEQTRGVSLYLDVDNSRRDGAVSFIDSLLDEHDVVLIDSLAKLKELDTAGRSAGVWKDDYAAIDRYRRRVASEQKMLLILAHTSKGANHGDANDAIATTGGTLAAADGHLTMQRADKADPARVRLQVSSRDTVLPPQELRFDPRPGVMAWVSFGEWVNLSEQQADILSALLDCDEHGPGLTYAELAAQVGTTDNNAQKTCSYLRKRGLLSSVSGAGSRQGRIGAPLGRVRATPMARQRQAAMRAIELHHEMEAVRRAAEREAAEREAAFLRALG